MVTTKPNLDPEGLYTIKQVRELLEISYSTIHRSVNKGILKVSHHPAFGRPFVKGSDIIVFWKGDIIDIDNNRKENAQKNN